MPEVETIKLPMVCRCGKPEDSERRDRADALRAEVRELLTWDAERPCTDSNFVSRIIMNLRHNFNASIDIGVDMWFGATATVEKYVTCEHWDDEKDEEISECPEDCFNNDFVPVLRVTCQADCVEDAFAAIYKWFYENRNTDE